MSGDKEQEYFSDGLSEELLNSLAEINELQVAARTSSFYFKGEHADIGTIAHKLNVGAVLEGSVRRSAHTVRVTAQFNNAVTGFHLWSQTYDRDLGDVLKLQTEIADAVTSALKITLFGVSRPKSARRDANPAAFDAYLRGAKAYSSTRQRRSARPDCGLHGSDSPRSPLCARVRGRWIALPPSPGKPGTAAAVREGYDKARADARQALALAPDLAEAHLALAYVWRRGSTLRRRMTNTSAPSRSRRAMQGLATIAANLRPGLGA